VNKIKRRRLELELNQHDVAKLSGISQTKISLFENDYRKPSPKEKNKLAKVLNVDVPELFRD